MHVVWGGPGIPEGGGHGYWTKNRKEMPKSRFLFSSDVNDIHFSPTGRVPRLPPIPAPPEANDVEIGWEEDGRITEAWWTRDGQQLAAIPVSGDAQELSLQFNRQRRQSTQGTATTQLVGLVYDKDNRAGEQLTMSLTTNPKKYQNIPGLGVIEMQAPLKPNASGQATLEGTIVDLGDGRQQSATEPLTIQPASNTTSIPVKLSSSGNPNPLVQSNLPISTSASQTAVTNTGKPSDFTTPPVVLNTSVIHGPLSGNGNATRITVDNQPAKIVAESGKNAYFDLPASMPVASHTVVMQDGGRSAQFPIVNMTLVMQADQTQLQRGQSTNYSATVRIGPLPNEIWQRGGIPPGQPGVVNLRVENASRDVVSIVPSQNEVVTRTLHQQDFQNGQFTLTGRIQSKQSGGFVLNGLAEASFAPIQGEELSAGVSGQPSTAIDFQDPNAHYEGDEISEVSQMVGTSVFFRLGGNEAVLIQIADIELVKNANGFVSLGKLSGKRVWGSNRFEEFKIDNSSEYEKRGLTRVTRFNDLNTGIEGSHNQFHFERLRFRRLVTRNYSLLALTEFSGTNLVTHQALFGHFNIVDRLVCPTVFTWQCWATACAGSGAFCRLPACSCTGTGFCNWVLVGTTCVSTRCPGTCRNPLGWASFCPCI